MSKSSELDRTVKLYILDNIDCEGSTQDKINYLSECFNAEAGWNIERVGTQEAMTEWLQGLPSAVSIEFYNFAILKLAVLWGSIPENYTEKQADKILDNYWRFMAVKMNQLISGYRVPKS